jgi:stage V sporulation protein AE
MSYLIAFLIGGAICALGQIVLEYTTWTPAVLLVVLTIIGGILGGLGLYQPLVDFAGAGALIPVSGFGSSVALGAISEAKRLGLVGLFTGPFEIVGLGTTAAVIFGFLMALFFTPKE